MHTALSRDIRETMSWAPRPLPQASTSWGPVTRPGGVVGLCRAPRDALAEQWGKFPPRAAATLVHTVTTHMAARRGSPRSPDAQLDPALTEAQPPLLPKDGLLQGTAVRQQLPGSGRQAPLHDYL